MQVVNARKRGQVVIGEPVASGLALDETAMQHEDFAQAGVRHWAGKRL